jgi:hypothetical protein
MRIYNNSKINHYEDAVMNIYKSLPPITIGEMELLAGVEDRRVFWKSLIPVFQHQGSDEGMSAWRKKVEDEICRRVSTGELSVLYPMETVRNTEISTQSSLFKKNQKVVAVDGRYEARVLNRHKDGSITIRQGFMLKDGEPVAGTFLGDKHRINPALVRAVI